MRISILLLGLLVGCNSNESSTNNQISNVDLNGSWATTCQPSDYVDEISLGVPTWTIHTYTFANEKVNEVVEFFIDEECDSEFDPSADYVSEEADPYYGESGSLRFLENVESSNGLKISWYEYISNGSVSELGFYFDSDIMHTAYLSEDIYYIFDLVTFYKF